VQGDGHNVTSQNSSTPTRPNTGAEAEIAEIPIQMIAAWNRGDAEAFAAPFTETADFIAFEGTHLRGRAEIAAFHGELFATLVKGSRLEGGVRFVRLLGPDWAIVHAWARYLNLPGTDPAIPGRDSMQLFVVSRRDGRWVADAVQNSRQLTVDQQQALDDETVAASSRRGHEST
jgi:uncharacterized protein (TIGR02246 family)